MFGARPKDTTPVDRTQSARTSPLFDWYRDHRGKADINISSSAVQPYKLGSVLEMLGMTATDLAEIALDDSLSYGAPSLRQAIAQRYAGGRLEWVMATHGSSEAIALGLSVLLRPKDRVVVLDPIYPSLTYFPEKLGCELVRIPVRRLAATGVNEDPLRQLITPPTRAVILNFPHNPTGASLSVDDYHRILISVADANAVLVWDAAFAELVHAGDVLPDPSLFYPNSISFGTLSKAFGLPGLRVGWCIAPPEFLRQTLSFKDNTTLGLSPIIEHIATRAIESADLLIEPRVQQARRNLAKLETWVTQHERFVAWRKPAGGVCCLLELKTVRNVRTFCLELLDRHHTLLLPGAVFGCPGAVRLGFGGDEACFTQGLEAVSRLLHEHEHTT